MRNSASPWGKGYTYKNYKAGLPKGVSNKPGDVLIDVDEGRAFRVVEGPGGSLRLLDIKAGMVSVVNGWEDLVTMRRVAPGETLCAGAREWKVTKVDENTISLTSENGEASQSNVVDLAAQIRAEVKAHHEADAARTREKARRRDAVKLILDDAKVEYTALYSDPLDDRAGVGIKGLEDREALPDALVVLADQADGVIVGLKSEIEQAMNTAADEAGVPDLAGDEALTEDGQERCSECGKPLNYNDDDLCNDCLLGRALRAHGELEAVSIKPNTLPSAANWLKEQKAVGPGPEPKKSRVEISTLVSISHHGEFNDITVPAGWDFVSVDYRTFTDGDAEYVRDVRHIRYITLKRVVSE